jgi:hypothetical protein
MSVLSGGPEDDALRALVDRPADVEVQNSGHPRRCERHLERRLLHCHGKETTLALLEGMVIEPC